LVATDGRVRALLKNFLGTYTSRYSDFQGYWLFGFLVADLAELRIDLLAAPTPATEGPLSAAGRLAVEKFQDQMRKLRAAPSGLRGSWLTLRRSTSAAMGDVNGHACLGYSVHFEVKR